MKFSTDQESFWNGAFGDEYVDRNRGENHVAANCALFSKILSRTNGVESVIEYGANIGLNLRAIKTLLPQTTLSAVEINRKAASELRNWAPGNVEVFEDSILEFSPTRTYDFVLVKGVLIHINSDNLDHVYDLLVTSSRKYVCIVEYYNPTPIAVSYRGHDERLYKRDFAGELLDRHSRVQLVDYGFVYRRDANFRQDDVTWFLLEIGIGNANDVSVA